MTKTQKLQEIADELRTNDQYKFWIEYRGGAGWWATCETRWIGDEGEYLGRDYHQAKITLHLILG